MKAWFVLLALLAAPLAAAPRLPPCQPKRDQLFLSPMGEPFRAALDAAYPVAAWFARADRDHDGKLSLAEALADADRFFARLDTDHDGEITPTENRAYEDDMAPEIRSQVGRTPYAEAPRRRDRHAIPVPDGAGRWSLIDLPQPVISADDDMNRGVTLAEFRQAMTARFARIDSAGTANLTLATLPKTPAQAAAEAPCAAP